VLRLSNKEFTAVVDFHDVASGSDIEEIRSLFIDYGRSLNFDLCFQSFDQELRDLPGAYARPRGRLILARVDGSAAGCVALKPLGDDSCEMKRLYVRPQFRGQQLGKALVSRAVHEARAAAYKSVRLDTIGGTMDHAIALYRSLGFREIPPYYPNPVPNATYFELTF
jgi:ribosomal protein S18 acetylase RimI-like enzyme